MLMMACKLLEIKKVFFNQLHGLGVKKALLALIVLFSGLFYSQYATALAVSRGPYLQTETASSIIIRYRTDTPTDSVVRYGTTLSQLNESVSIAGSTTEHTVMITDLAADTRYYYSVGNSVGTLEGGSADYSFVTAPVSGTAKPTRIWVIGDSGTANSNARAVRDAYKTYTGNQPTDLWLMLGDNAYNAGTDSEYQNAVFNTYPELLQQVALWPVLGNHDGSSSDSASESGPYYDIFNLPRAGEAGGIASGTEAYYSFDYGNIHFIAMDSFETDRSVGGTMLTWLESDLLANDKPWIIAFWHHPPYTKGSHDSDGESRLIEMRQNALPILENHGVDLVLSGHSHAYERSMLINGHYGQSSSLTNAMILNSGSGQANTTDGAYSKTGGVAIANEGAVYAVAGSSGKVSGGNLNHPAMYISLNLLGSMVIDVNGNQLNARFLDSTGAVQDYFSLVKGADITPPLLSSVTSNNANSVLVQFSEPVEQGSAETLANYVIDQTVVINSATLQADGRSVLLSTSTLISGNPYTLTVNQVTDLVLNPIAANTQGQFSFLNLQDVSFQDGVWPGASYQGTIDTYLSQNSASTNFGNNSDLQADGDDPGGSGRDLAILLRWNLNAVPSGAVIESASIELNVLNPSGNSYPLYQLQRDWFETEANWNEAQTGQAWAVAGAQSASDRGTTILGNLSAGSAGTNSIALNAEALNVLQNWINGSTPNYGFIIASSSNADGVDLSSSDTANTALRPRLNLTYSVSGGSQDTTPPSVPANLLSITQSATSATLSWNASTDNIGVAGYKLFRDGTELANQNATSYVDNGLQAGTSYQYRVSAYDTAGNESAQSTVLTVTTTNSGSIDVRVNQSSDDAEQRADGSMYLNSSDLELTTDGSLQQTVGMRFANIQIPPGATIQNAYIQFEVDEINSGATALTIHGEDIADATGFSFADNNITARTLSNASVNWNPVPWTEVNAQTLDQRTPDLSTIIQEIVSRTDWQTGNSVVAVISGTGERTAESFDGEASAAPLLHVEYTLDLVVNQAPGVNAGGDLSVQLPASVSLSEATVSDDGLLNPTPVLNWSILSSPTGSNVVFSSTSALNPTVTVDMPGLYTLQLSANDGDLIAVDSLNLSVTAADIEAPSVPENLILVEQSATTAALSWGTSTDNIGVTGYKLFRDGIELANQNTSSYVDTGLQAGTSYQYQVSAYDAAANESAQSTVLTVTTPNSGSIDVRVNQSNDDAEQRNDGSMYLNSSDLELTTDGSRLQTVGMRFANIQIPPGATIQNAYIQFEVDETDSGTTTLTIHGEDVADASGFSSVNSNITARVLTNASVNWDPVPWAVINAQTLDQRTPDLSAIIQEIVSRTDWQTGNSVVAVISGTGERTAESFDGEASAAPSLHVEYTLDPIVNQAPVVNAGGDLSVQLPASVSLSEATVSDDGLLSPTPVLNWSVLSSTTGSNVVFSSTSALNPTVSVDMPGLYTLQLSANDGGLSSVDSLNLSVTATSNQIPTALFSTAPQQGEAPLIVNFDAGASSDNDGTIVDYSWDFGDGQTDSGVTQNHLFTQSGSYSVQLTVTDNLGATAQATNIITVTTTNQAPSALFSSTPQQGDAPLTVSFDATASNDSDGAIVSYAWDFGDGQTGSGITQNHLYTQSGSYLVQLTVTDNQGATAQVTTTITVDALQEGLLSEHGVLTGISNQQWTTVNLNNQYTSMVVIATPVYSDDTPPLVTRIRNAVGNSFELQVQVANATGDAVLDVNVHYLIVEEGVYTTAEHGVKLEAIKINSTQTDSDSSWIAQSRSYINSYSNPVVLGQVMTENDTRFSAFWARGSSRSRAPTASTLFVGKHVAEDSQTDRADETIGYLVIEAGQGSLAGNSYFAGLGADNVRGITNSPPYSYSVSGLSSATTAVLSSAAMDGVNGGWPMLYGNNPVSITSINLAIDEDQFKDNERKHTSEQAAFIVLQ